MSRNPHREQDQTFQGVAASHGNFFPACHFNALKRSIFEISKLVVSVPRILLFRGNFYSEVSLLKHFKRVSSFSLPRLLAIAAAVALCCSFLQAQQTLGGITGEVTDASGGVIPNAYRYRLPTNRPR